MLAFCRGGRTTPNVAGVKVERSDDDCRLEVEDATLRVEATQVLRVWSVKERGTIIDARNELTADVEVTADKVSVRWTHHVSLEKIFGTGGQLLKGVDPSRFLGLPPDALRAGITKPFVVVEGCDANGCSAEGPRAPGGVPVRIGYMPSIGPVVTINTTKPLIPRVHELIAASLGPGQQDGPATNHVHEHDGIRYQVRDETNGRTVTVTISR